MAWSNSGSSTSDPFSRFSSAQPMTAPVSEPLASSEAADEALFEEDEDWLVEALLA